MGEPASAKGNDNGMPAAALSQCSASTALSTNASCTFEDGSAYEGCFALSSVEADEKVTYVPHGTGMYVRGTYRSFGEWRDGKMTQGSIFFPSGDSYEGQLLNGFFHGWGRYTRCKGNLCYEGMWVNGLMEGPGTLQFSSPHPGEKLHPMPKVNSLSLTCSAPSASAHRDSSYVCRGIFGTGRFHQTPSLQAALQAEYSKRYRADWLEAALGLLQQLEVALVQNLSFSAFIGGGQSVSPGESTYVAASANAAIGGKNRNNDTARVAIGGRAKKKPLGLPRSSTSGTAQNKDLSVGNAGSSFLENEKCVTRLYDYVAEKYVMPPYPGSNDFQLEGISRLMTAARCYYEMPGYAGTSAYSVEVQIPEDEEGVFDLSLLDRARILDAKKLAGRGSGQTVEILLRASDGTGTIIAGIVLVNCNDQVATPEASQFRVVSLVLPSPHQLKKLKF